MKLNESNGAVLDLVTVKPAKLTDTAEVQEATVSSRGISFAAETPVETPVAEVVKAETPAETPAKAEKPSEELEKLAVLKFGRHNVPVARIAKALQDASSNAGRYEKEAQRLNLGRVAKSMSGDGQNICTPAVINELHKLGIFGPTSGDTKHKAQMTKDQLQGLNMIVDGLVKLGLTKRI